MDTAESAESGLAKRLARVGVLPVLVLDDAGKALPIASALADGGIDVIEVTLRHKAAPEAIRAIAEARPDLLVGAGTVLNPAQYRMAREAGADFIVAPGLNDDLVRIAGREGMPILPGIATPTELLRAWNLGLRIVKFFPAEQLGGVATLKAFSSVFQDTRFVPTGGISPDNLEDYLQQSSVLACGGSWLAPTAAIHAGRFEQITQLASAARGLAASCGAGS